MKKVFVFLIIIYLFLLVVISEKDLPMSELLFYQDNYSWEYLYFSLNIMKLLIIIYITFLYLYATKWSKYDVYLLIRASKIKVQFSRYVLLLYYGLSLKTYFLVIFGLMYTLYPYELTYVFITKLWGFLFFFVFYYSTLFFFLEIMIKGIASLFIPLLGYLIQLLFFSIDGLTEQTFFSDFIQLFVPDVTIRLGGIYTLYSPLILGSVSIVMLVASYKKIIVDDAYC